MPPLWFSPAQSLQTATRRHSERSEESLFNCGDVEHARQHFARVTPVGVSTTNTKTARLKPGRYNC
jgi:hypothetical protein